MREDTASQDKAEAEDIKKPARRKEKKPPRRISEKYLYNSGLAYLQRFPASTAHFRQVMGRKIDRSCRHYPEQDRESCAALLDGAVAAFTRMGLLDDTAYLSGMVNSLRRRGLSRNAILQKLQHKGLVREEIHAALQGYDQAGPGADADLLAALRLARRKRLGPYRRSEVTAGQKELAAFARAGFSFDVAQKISGMTQDEAAQLAAGL